MQLVKTVMLDNRNLEPGHFSAIILIFKLVFSKSCNPMFFRSGFRISQYNNYPYRCRLLFPETLPEPVPVLSLTLYSSLVQSLIHLNTEQCSSAYKYSTSNEVCTSDVQAKNNHNYRLETIYYKCYSDLTLYPQSLSH